MNRTRLLLSLALMTIAAAACVRAPVERVEWPQDLPPMDHYDRLYQEDEANRAVQSREQYLKWVVRFYKGWKLYQDGWHTMTHDVLAGMESGPAKRRMRTKMAHLGRLVSGEWAKDSNGRRIRSRELSIWGQALVNALDRGEEERLIDEVTRDVEALLAGRLDPLQVKLSRY